ncbi:MAG: PAS domain-containing protein [Gemmataceae bacterium]
MHPIIAEGYAYWRRKRGDRPLPACSDIDLSEIKRILPHVMLFDVVGLYDQCADARRLIYSERLFFYELGSEVERHVKVLFMLLSTSGALVDTIFVIQVIEFMNKTLRNQHFTLIRPHKAIVRVVL